MRGTEGRREGGTERQREGERERGRDWEIALSAENLALRRGV